MSSASRFNSEANNQSASHEARFTSPTIHFTMTSHARGTINLGVAVRRLLRADLAVAAAWPSGDGIWVTPKLRSLARSMKKGQRLQKDFQNFQEQRSSRALINFAVRHPRLATQSLLTRTESSIENIPQEGEAASFPNIENALSFGQEALIEAQKIAAVERSMDASLFGGKSRDDDEFVRLTLRGSYHDFILPGTRDVFRVVCEPRLLLHRSGLVQLTLAVPIDQEISTTQLVSLSRSDKAAVARSEIPEPLLIDLPVDKIMGRWSDQLDASARLRVMEFEDPYTMADILERHLEAVGAVVAKRLPSEWNTHATVIAGAGSCCKEQTDWSHQHEVDVARVATRVESKSPMNIALIRTKNLATFSDHVLYTNLGSSTRIQLEGDSPIAIDELNTVLIIEHALMQYFQLRSLELALNYGDLYGTKLEKVQRTALRVFSDMRQHEIRHGTARDIVRELLADLGGEEMRHTIESGLNLAVQANATRAAASQSRRSVTLTVIATVLASLVAIPTLSELLDQVSSMDPTSVLGQIILPLRWAAEMGDRGPWIIVTGLLALFLLLLTGSYMRRGCVRLSDVLRSRTRRGGPKLPAEYTLSVQHYEELTPHDRSDEA